MTDHEWVNTAKAGDIVFISTRNTLEKTTIHHITLTMVVVNRGNSTMRFNKMSCSYSSGAGDFYSLYENTEKLQHQYWRNQMSSKLNGLVITIDKNIRTKTMTDEQLKRWIEILTPLEKELNVEVPK
jgi:hypothetical protein